MIITLKALRKPVITLAGFSAVKIGKVRCFTNEKTSFGKPFDVTLKTMLARQHYQVIHSTKGPLSPDSFSANFQGFFRLKTGYAMTPDLFTVHNRMALCSFIVDYGLNASVQIPVFKDILISHFLHTGLMNTVIHFVDQIDKIECEIDLLESQHKVDKADEKKYILMDLFSRVNHHFYSNDLMKYGQPLFISYLEYRRKYRTTKCHINSLYTQLELNSDAQNVLTQLHPEKVKFYLHHAIQQGYKPSLEFVDFVTKKRLVFDEHKIPQESFEDLTTMMFVFTGEYTLLVHAYSS